ncbi:unnamed protein product [Oncorhynchus mykiss]|uniref:Uncharacterized protein n=1 Tax=Oncorhynchus mykiss TaxID=8022 RepID=A0A060XAM8_ONCMY|nr:unnamed protein product [Oncorhynchus mykiss]
MSSRKVMAIQARKRRPKGKKTRQPRKEVSRAAVGKRSVLGVLVVQCCAVLICCVLFQSRPLHHQWIRYQECFR